MGDFNAKQETKKIFDAAKNSNSLKDTYLQHAANYGIQEIEQLFPEAKALTNKPTFLNNKVEWVNDILGGVNKLPFSRVRSMFTDIAADSIRAKGYVKGGLKTEDVLTLMKRTSEPYTIYKKGKLDRDDIIDITDFAVVAWIKEAMKMKLDEEVARSILIGDGRLNSDNHKIDEECIRPIYNDSDLYTIKAEIDKTSGTNPYKEFIKTCVRARKNYRGSGNPTLFTTEDLIAEILLLEDNNGRRIYNTVEDIKSVLRVGKIVTLNEMIGLVRPTNDSKAHNVMGIIVNLTDYSVGTDKGGAVSMFDDFDIDYNQQKYLIETRCSGALTVPYSALVIENVTTTLSETPDEE